MKVLYALSFCTLLLTCKSTSEQTGSQVKDIGGFNTVNGKAVVLYEDNGQVYRKICVPTPAPPLTRNCTSRESPKSMPLESYLKGLPFDCGPYNRDESGRDVVTKLIKDAQTSGQTEVVSRLEKNLSNIKKVLSIRDNLKKDQTDLTYYEYQEDYSKLLFPFGETGNFGSSGSGGVGGKFVATAGIPPFVIIEVQSAGSYTTRSVKSNYDGSRKCSGLSVNSQEEAIAALGKDKSCIDTCKVYKMYMHGSQNRRDSRLQINFRYEFALGTTSEVQNQISRICQGVSLDINQNSQLTFDPGSISISGG